MPAVLERRERAALVRVKELRAEFERVRAALAEAEDVLNHRVIGLEQYLEALAEHDVFAAADGCGGPAAAEARAEEPASVAEPRRNMARKEDGVSVEVRGADYRRIVAVLEKSKEFAQACAELGVIRSRGAVGTSADNAAAESFNATMKRETFHGRKRWSGAREARLAVFRWATRYNTRRRHSSIGQISPIAFEQQRSVTLANAA